MNILNFLYLFILLGTCFAKKDYATDYSKETCPFFTGHFKVGYCNIRNIKTSWRLSSIGWSPSQTLNQTFDELKEHCDDDFVCYENTGCYKDFVNYQNLDTCIEESFQMGPWGYCEDKLREVQKATPEKLEDCTKRKLDDPNPEKIDCLSIYETAKCYLNDVEKHCDSHLFEIYKQHYKLRLYNRACDGRLRYKDWDYKSGQDFAIQIGPGVFKVADPKRDFNSTGSFEEIPH